MTAKKTRRKPPEEDLAAAVADIINSPITRSNLSFLRGPDAVPVDAPAATPTGFELTPTGVEEPIPHPASVIVAPPKPEIRPKPLEIPEGEAPPPMGFELTPPGFRPYDVIRRTTERPAWKPTAHSRTFWQAEGLNSLIEQSRVRRIHQAQDALSLVEEKVYDLLWGTRNQKRDEFRLVHYSLQRISSEARINIKTVRELIPRLIEKGFIQIEHEADARRNIPTLYRVYGYSAILADQKRRNRQYVAKTGKGVVYVHPLSGTMEPSDPGSEPMGLDLQPTGVTPTGDTFGPTGAAPMGPLGREVPKPMGPGGTVSLGSLKDSKNRQTTTLPATLSALIKTVQDILGVEPDNALLTGIVDACHQNSIQTTGEQATDEELLYFTGSKARVILRSPNIRNHLAVLRKAVPECFLGESFQAYRAAAAFRKQKSGDDDQRNEAERVQRAREAAEAEARYAVWGRISEQHRDERGYDMQAIAEDPNLDDLGKQQARRLLERLGRYTRSGL